MHNGRKLCKKKRGCRKIVILSPWGTLMVVLVIILVFYAPAASERITAIATLIAAITAAQFYLPRQAT
ncbi:hypothetical protein ACFOY2_39650 [Nonomuraea purpurea]|uniref:Uncharacterized protein n=1 Tax=Nonomuraea purpurea TaxID=1849276 RepID=A0ABV8GHH7_9ACTN